MCSGAKALGSQPVLIYRLKPWLLRALDHMLMEELEAGQIKPLPQVVADLTGRDTTYGQDPVKPFLPTKAGTYKWSAEQVIDVRMTCDDQERINAVHVRSPVQPTTAVESYGLFATPSYARQDIDRHGLRLMDLDWGFLTPYGREAPVDFDFDDEVTFVDEATEKEKLDAFNQIVYAMLANNFDALEFGRCQVTTKFRPHAGCGHWALIDLPPDLQYEKEGSGAGLSGYIEEITHSLTAAPDGTVKRDTSFTLSRVDLSSATPQQYLDTGET